MALSMTPSMEAILDRMRTRLVPEVHDTEVPPDDELQYVNGIMSPYYVVMFGGPVRAARGKSITGVRDHVTILYCTVQCVAPDSNGRNHLIDGVIDTLTGYRPPECGEMILEGGMAYTNGNTTVRPTKYFKDIVFTYRANLKLDN